MGFSSILLSLVVPANYQKQAAHNYDVRMI